MDLSKEAVLIFTGLINSIEHLTGNLALPVSTQEAIASNVSAAKTVLSGALDTIKTTEVPAVVQEVDTGVKETLQTTVDTGITAVAAAYPVAAVFAPEIISLANTVLNFAEGKVEDAIASVLHVKFNPTTIEKPDNSDATNPINAILQLISAVGGLAETAVSALFHAKGWTATNPPG